MSTSSVKAVSHASVSGITKRTTHRHHVEGEYIVRPRRDLGCTYLQPRIDFIHRGVDQLQLVGFTSELDQANVEVVAGVRICRQVVKKVRENAEPKGRARRILAHLLPTTHDQCFSKVSQ